MENNLLLDSVLTNLLYATKFKLHGTDNPVTLVLGSLIEKPHLTSELDQYFDLENLHLLKLKRRLHGLTFDFLESILEKTRTDKNEYKKFKDASGLSDSELEKFIVYLNKVYEYDRPLGVIEIEEKDITSPDAEILNKIIKYDQKILNSLNVCIVFTPNNIAEVNSYLKNYILNYSKNQLNNQKRAGDASYLAQHIMNILNSEVNRKRTENSEIMLNSNEIPYLTHSLMYLELLKEITINNIYLNDESYEVLMEINRYKDILQFGALWMNIKDGKAGYEITGKEAHMDIGGAPYIILKLLLENALGKPGKDYVSYEEFMELTGINDKETIKAKIREMRTRTFKIKDSHKPFEAVRGKGYKLVKV